MQNGRTTVCGVQRAAQIVVWRHGGTAHGEHRDHAPLRTAPVRLVRLAGVERVEGRLIMLLTTHTLIVLPSLPPPNINAHSHVLQNYTLETVLLYRWLRNLIMRACPCPHARTLSHRETSAHIHNFTHTHTHPPMPNKHYVWRQTSSKRSL